MEIRYIRLNIDVDVKVPSLHFKLLSCVSKAREEGIPQPEAAKLTNQDPRSLFGRTRRLGELGMMYLTGCSLLTNVEQRLLSFTTEPTRID
jgi:B-block binding subunit of TFIIIC